MQSSMLTTQRWKLTKEEAAGIRQFIYTTLLLTKDSCFMKVRVYELLQILCLYVMASDTYIDSIPVNRTVYLTFAVSIVTCCSVPVISMYMY